MNNTYTKKVGSLFYEPKGDCPSVEQMIDIGKTKELLDEINSTAMPDEYKRLLTIAAYRHIKYNYAKIAEYYCHAPANVQRLMEKSALVVIDFDDAIKMGFTVFNKKLEELRGCPDETNELTLKKRGVKDGQG